MRLLRELGLRDVGENRDAEAAPKAAECADLDLTWHFIGQLQTNKCASVVRYASVVHSVDRLRLIRALGKAARGAGRVIESLIEVSLDGDPARGGSLAGDVPALAEALEAEEGLVSGRRDGHRSAGHGTRGRVRGSAGERRSRTGDSAGRHGDFGRHER